LSDFRGNKLAIPITAIKPATTTTREYGVKNSAMPNGGKVEKNVKMSAEAKVTNKPNTVNITEISLLLAARKYPNHASRSSAPARIRFAMLDSHKNEERAKAAEGMHPARKGAIPMKCSVKGSGLQDR
jgi:hypothetical protein